jgi:hypothetical protein
MLIRKVISSSVIYYLWLGFSLFVLAILTFLLRQTVLARDYTSKGLFEMVFFGLCLAGATLWFVRYIKKHIYFSILFDGSIYFRSVLTRGIVNKEEIGEVKHLFKGLCTMRMSGETRYFYATEDEVEDFIKYLQSPPTGRSD